MIRYEPGGSEQALRQRCPEPSDQGTRHRVQGTTTCLGWRSDTLEIIQRQIDLAADHGLLFWAFCWYYHAGPHGVESDSKHTGLCLFLQAPNRHRLRSCLLVANHDPYRLQRPEDWHRVARHWVPLFKEPEHLRLNGSPMVIVFNPRDVTADAVRIVNETPESVGLPKLAWVGCGTEWPEVFVASTHDHVNSGWMKGWQERPIERLYEFHQAAWKSRPGQPHIPCVSVGWDRRPWETAQKGSWYYTGNTPEKWKAHVRELIAWMANHPDQITPERYAVIYAWNGLGEGGYLVPT